MSETIKKEKLNTFREDVDNSDDKDWHVSTEKYWSHIDKRFYGPGTPNETPLIDVPAKLAADMEYIDDAELATQVASLLNFSNSESYEAVIRIKFNDFSTWNWPLLVGNREFTDEVKHFIDRYFPEILKWDAIVAGEDPQRAVEEWKDPNAGDNYSWTDDVDQTDMSEETRKYFNENKEWMPEIRKTIKNEVSASDVNVSEDEDWMEDW